MQSGVEFTYLGLFTRKETHIKVALRGKRHTLKGSLDSRAVCIETCPYKCIHTYTRIHKFIYMQTRFTNECYTMRYHAQLSSSARENVLQYKKYVHINIYIHIHVYINVYICKRDLQMRASC